MKRNILKSIAFIGCICGVLTAVTHLNIARTSRLQDSKRAIKAPEKTVDQVGKNIKVLNGLPVSQLYPTMRFMAASLGFQCGDCHVINDGRIDAPLDEKPEKQTARQMIRMVIEINKLQFKGNPTVSCYTCHRGNRTPQGALVLPLPSLSPRPAIAVGDVRTSSPLPAANDVLNKYFIAIGGKATADRITTCVVKGTTTTAIRQTVAYESEQLAPDKGDESFAIQDVAGRCTGDSRCEYERVINGQQGWLKSGAGVQELVGLQLTDQKLTFPLFQILKLNDQYSSFRVMGRDQIDDRDVYVVSAIRLDEKPERLYFDVESGLLRRRISYLLTLVGTIPQQTDFEDYREVNGVKLPFTITFAFADPGSAPIIRKFTEIRVNVPLDESKFGKPN